MCYKKFLIIALIVLPYRWWVSSIHWVWFVGEEGVFSPKPMLWQFWGLSSGFRFGYAEIPPALNLPIAIPSSGCVDALEKVMEPL